jgi:aminoglycoside phosphotransferase family enzyme
VDLAAKVSFLSQPGSFPDCPPAVEAIETHFAWVFLAGPYAYKLKKPMRFHDFDFTSLATRRANCELEVTLNRRLAPAVYIATVPLCTDGNRLALGEPGTPIEWLVKMHRLPQRRALDQLAASGQVQDEQLALLMRTLSEFYAAAPRAPWDGLGYRRALIAEIEGTAAELAAETRGLDAEFVYRIAAGLEDRVALARGALHDRVDTGRVVDAHGDLRPEHVFLTEQPQVIDSLELSAELRKLDSAAEIAFLALECERLGHTALAARIVELYRQYARDDIGEELLGFYRALRAFVRAKVAAWHLDEEITPTAAAYWRARTQWYLDVAAREAATHPHEQRTTGGAS